MDMMCPMFRPCNAGQTKVPEHILIRIGAGATTVL